MLKDLPILIYKMRIVSKNMLQLLPIKTRRFDSPFDIFDVLESYLKGVLMSGDVIVLSSKFVSLSEGSFLDLSRVRPSPESKELSEKFNLDREFAEVIQRESDDIISGVSGFLLCVKSNMLCPNAGVDKSNIQKGRVVIYPRDPGEAALLIRDEMKFRLGVDVGVVLSDSRLMPMRKGTIGVALASAGLEGLVDMRGRKDLFGKVLRVTVQSLADDLCSAAQPLMGESNEAVPIVLVRGLSKSFLSHSLYNMEDFGISRNQCVYMRSFFGLFLREQKGYWYDV